MKILCHTVLTFKQKIQIWKKAQASIIRPLKEKTPGRVFKKHAFHLKRWGGLVNFFQIDTSYSWTFSNYVSMIISILKSFFEASYYKNFEKFSGTNLELAAKYRYETRACSIPHWAALKPRFETFPWHRVVELFDETSQFKMKGHFFKFSLLNWKKT